MERIKREWDGQEEIGREKRMMKEDERKRQTMQSSTGTREKRNCSRQKTINKYTSKNRHESIKRKNIYYTFLFAHYLVSGLRER